MFRVGLAYNTVATNNITRKMSDRRCNYCGLNALILLDFELKEKVNCGERQESVRRRRTTKNVYVPIWYFVSTTTE